jgi:hypothetical protein
MKSDVDKLLKKHKGLTHSDMQKVTSHVQRRTGDWITNTLMIEGCSAPFKFRRKDRYRDLKGARVNLTYYPDIETVSGFELEVMNVVRVRIA